MGSGSSRPYKGYRNWFTARENLGTYSPFQIPVVETGQLVSVNKTDADASTQHYKNTRKTTKTESITP